jgi:hypothetical protein
MYGDNIDDIPDFSVGYVGEETWGTNYGLEDIFNDENEKANEGKDRVSAQDISIAFPSSS